MSKRLRDSILRAPSAKPWMLHSSFHPQASSAGDGRDSTWAGRRQGHLFLLGPCIAPLAYPRAWIASCHPPPPSGSGSTPLLPPKAPQILQRGRCRTEIKEPSRDTQHSVVEPAQDRSEYTTLTSEPQTLTHLKKKHPCADVGGGAGSVCKGVTRFGAQVCSTLAPSLKPWVIYLALSASVSHL